MNDNHNFVLNNLINSLEYIKQFKPQEQSELTRRYTITITELEKVMAYFKVYVVDEYSSKEEN